MQAKKKWEPKYKLAMSEEITAIGGLGSTPALDVLRGLDGVRVHRAHSCYVGHVGIHVFARDLKAAKEAVRLLRSAGYYYIDDCDLMTEKDLGWKEIY